MIYQDAMTQKAFDKLKLISDMRHICNGHPHRQYRPDAYTLMDVLRDICTEDKVRELVEEAYQDAKITYMRLSVRPVISLTTPKPGQ